MSLELLYFSGGPRHRVLEAVMQAGHRLLHVFVNDPARWPKVTPTIEIAQRAGVPVTVVTNKGDLASIADLAESRLCLSVGFAYLFPKTFLSGVKACLNVHGSLLPKYAGARTLSWAIEDGERESGVTVHLVDEGMDTGPILLQEAFPLSPFETTASLARKTTELEPRVVVAALKRYEQLGEKAYTPQSRPPPPPRPNRIPAHSQVDCNKPLIDLVNKIRAAHPELYPAHFFLHGEKVCIRLWRPNKRDDEADMI